MIDGSSLLNLYKALSEIVKYSTIIEFKIEIENTIRKTNVIYTNIEDFHSNYLEYLKSINVQCYTGPYFRLKHIFLKNGDNLYKYYVNTTLLVENFKYENYDKIQTYIKEILAKFLIKQDFIINLRKARYVDPCYMDVGYIDEQYNNYQN